MLRYLLFLSFLVTNNLFAQHTIKGRFSPPEDYKIAILYKVEPTTSVYVLNTEIEKDGSFVFEMDSTYAKGVYRLVFAMPQEDYNFDIIYNAKEDIELTYNAETGINYQVSKENKLWTSYTHSMSLVSQSIGNFYQQQSKDTVALASIFKTQREAQTNFEDAAKETMALDFIKANRPYIPQRVEDVSSYIENLEDHFFDHIDFNNKVLQSSSFLSERMFNYVLGMSFNEDGSIQYKKNIDAFYEVMKEAPSTIKRALFYELWEEMTNENFQETANYISEAYLIEISKSLKDQELVDALILYRNLSIGKVAPDFSFETREEGKTITKKLSGLNEADTYVIVFWSSGCSHCLLEMPQLKTYVKSFEKNKLQVISIGLEEEPSQWEKAILDFSDFMHVYGEGKWDNPIGKSYDVNSTPTYFVLDKNKKIISKPKDFESLKAFLEK